MGDHPEDEAASLGGWPGTSMHPSTHEQFRSSWLQGCPASYHHAPRAPEVLLDSSSDGAHGTPVTTFPFNASLAPSALRAFAHDRGEEHQREHGFADGSQVATLSHLQEAEDPLMVHLMSSPRRHGAHVLPGRRVSSERARVATSSHAFGSRGWQSSLSDLHPDGSATLARPEFAAPKLGSAEMPTTSSTRASCRPHAKGDLAHVWATHECGHPERSLFATEAYHQKWQDFHDLEYMLASINDGLLPNPYNANGIADPGCQDRTLHSSKMPFANDVCSETKFGIMASNSWFPGSYGQAQPVPAHHEFAPHDHCVHRRVEEMAFSSREPDPIDGGLKSFSIAEHEKTIRGGTAMQQLQEGFPQCQRPTIIRAAAHAGPIKPDGGRKTLNDMLQAVDADSSDAPQTRDGSLVGSSKRSRVRMSQNDPDEGSRGRARSSTVHGDKQELSLEGWLATIASEESSIGNEDETALLREFTEWEALSKLAPNGKWRGANSRKWGKVGIELRLTGNVPSTMGPITELGSLVCRFIDIVDDTARSGRQVGSDLNAGTSQLTWRVATLADKQSGARKVMLKEKVWLGTYHTPINAAVHHDFYKVVLAVEGCIFTSADVASCATPVGKKKAHKLKLNFPLNDLPELMYKSVKFSQLWNRHKQDTERYIFRNMAASHVSTLVQDLIDQHCGELKDHISANDAEGSSTIERRSSRRRAGGEQSVAAGS